ncbi:hypothetical protein OH76DRAFT_1490639 [Lentinus brumalis]|uniref:Uncharacterized protein n=1 Tax=Lentinus brumalis TaxID=2498619 RepID=A0A371CIB2_9APHY|nr:hypothetical protein OH76DRAFT_1490639 [Polyporus brumalis]
MRLPTNINPTLFANELEYLYTGKGWGEAFEFLFDLPRARWRATARRRGERRMRSTHVVVENISRPRNTEGVPRFPGRRVASCSRLVAVASAPDARTMPLWAGECVPPR